MRQFFGSSQRGDLAEAVRGLRNPQFIMLLSNNDQFESHVSGWSRISPGWAAADETLCVSIFAPATTPAC